MAFQHDSTLAAGAFFLSLFFAQKSAAFTILKKKSVFPYLASDVVGARQPLERVVVLLPAAEVVAALPAGVAAVVVGAACPVGVLPEADAHAHPALVVVPLAELALAPPLGAPLPGGAVGAGALQRAGRDVLEVGGGRRLQSRGGALERVAEVLEAGVVGQLVVAEAVLVHQAGRILVRVSQHPLPLRGQQARRQDSQAQQQKHRRRLRRPHCRRHRGGGGGRNWP